MKIQILPTPSNNISDNKANYRMTNKNISQLAILNNKYKNN